MGATYPLASTRVVVPTKMTSESSIDFMIDSLEINGT